MRFDGVGPSTFLPLPCRTICKILNVHHLKGLPSWSPTLPAQGRTPLCSGALCQAGGSEAGGGRKGREGGLPF